LRTLFVLSAAILATVQTVAYAVDPPQVKIGAEVRLRGYYLDNFLDFDASQKRDEWSFFRLRTRVYVSAAMDNGVSAYVRIANQHFSEGVTAQPTDGDRWEEENKSNKFFVDAAYIDVKGLFGLPLDLQAGRQNLLYGSGWVIADGQSQYGSTSTYIDGIRLIWRMGTNVSLDALYFKDEEKKRDATTPDDITFAGLYLTSKAPLPIGQQEVYVLGRFDQLIRKEIYMAGGRLSNRYDSGIDYSAEGAWQTGKARPEVDHNAYGLKIDLGFTFKNVAASPRLYGGVVRLTGDDYGTADENEAWDVFYGGWPQYGDLLAWKYVNAGPDNSISIYDPNYNQLSTVGGEAVYSNVDMYTAGIEVMPIEALKTGVSYSRMIADETTAGIDNGLGDYYQLVAEYRYSEHLKFGMYAALIDPGDAFVGRSDPAGEAFWEINVGF